LTADASALPDDLRTNDPQTGNPQPLRAKADAIDTALTQLSRDLKRARHEQDEARTRETRLLSTLEERKQSAQRATEETARAETALSEALAAVPAPIAPENLPALIQETQELPDITKTILHHDQARTVVESRARQLAQRARDATPPDLDEPVHTALTRAETTVAEIQEELHQLDHRTGSLQRETDEITRQTTRRTELQTRQTHLSGRIENLNTLVKLFQGSKFVSYVASVFLEQLVALANDRFRRLTRNRLELALRGDHDFEVVDYLNGGRRRSVKTLSGGQTFQAALCLALALVDSIDHRAGTDMPGFFFLDEGFGSLDEESLRDVFATLTDLRRENRIVGVISHVESMQEEMETYLRISIDQEEGSVISTGVADPTDPTGAHIT
ncbi:MAG: SbcC/MukB-like Walker B domain-containing protein, partial [Alkalispirochaeta sp.]